MEYLTVRQAAEAILRGERLVNRHGEECRAVWLDAANADMVSVFALAPSAPRTITIGGMEVPEPCRTAPKNGQVYCIPTLHTDDKAAEYRWFGDETDFIWLTRGLVHLTEAAAIAHAKALIKVSGGEV